MRAWIYRTALLISVFGAAPTYASVAITIEQLGNDVVESASGSLDMSQLIRGTAATQSYTSAMRATIVMGPDTNASPDPDDHASVFFGYSFSDTAVSGPANFGSGTTFHPTSVSGATFGLLYEGTLKLQYIITPHDYVFGSAITSGAVFANQTLASMGLTEGTYVYSWLSDSITIKIGGSSTPVPEPATWAMMVGGFAIAGAAMRRQRSVVGLPPNRCFADLCY